MITATEASAITGYATRTLRLWARNWQHQHFKGRVIARKSGATWLFDREYIEERIKPKEQQPMSIQKQRIARKLKARGLYWTGEKELFPDDGIEANIYQGATYHIYDVDRLSRHDCLRFRTLADIEDWLAEWDASE